MPDSNASVGDGIAPRELCYRFEQNLHDLCRPAEVRTLEPQGADDGERQGREYDEAHKKLPAPVHEADSISSGLPSMKPFTIGSAQA